LLAAATTQNFNYACRVLKLDRHKASTALHAAKETIDLRGDNNCTFDTVTGDIIYNGQVIGNLRDLR
jgi:hypothetical protein